MRNHNRVRPFPDSDLIRNFSGFIIYNQQGISFLCDDIQFASVRGYREVVWGQIGFVHRIIDQPPVCHMQVT